MSDQNYQAATVEDYESDHSDISPNTSGTTSPAAKIANVAAKRTSQNLKTAAKAKVAPVDASSDSGYSSRTVGTVESASSAPQTQSERVQRRASAVGKSNDSSQTVVPAGRRDSAQATGKAPSPSKRPPAVRGDTTQSTSSDARPAGTGSSKAVRALQTTRERSTSQPRTSRPMQPQGCPDPYCPQCLSTRTPLETPWNVNYYPFGPQHPPPPPPSSVPPPPAHYGHPPQYQYPTSSGGTSIPSYPSPTFQTVPHLPEPTPRRRSGSSKPRPASYHPGATQEGYWVQIPQYYELPYDYSQGPASATTYTNPAMNSSSYYYPPTAPPISSAPNPFRAVEKPPLKQRNTDYPTSHPQTSGYGFPPPPTYDSSGYTSAASRRPSRPGRPSSPSYISEEPFYEQDRARMPPPPRPSTSTSDSRQMVALRRSSKTRHARSISPNGPEPRRKYESIYDVDAQQRKSTRPPLVAHQTTGHNKLEKTSSHDSANRGRRYSYVGHEEAKDIKKLELAEKHIAKTSGTDTRPTPLTQEALDRAVEKKKVTAGPSSPRRTESQRDGRNRSRASSSRDGSRAGRRNTSHTSRDDGFKIRMDAGQTFRVEFGDMEGKSISMVENEDGVRELVIGNSNPNRRQITYNQDGSVDSGESKSTSRTGRNSGTGKESEKPVKALRESSEQRRKSE